MVTRASPDTLLRTVLRSVARSFYLTLAVVPSDVRAQVGVAYLLARAADTHPGARRLCHARRSGPVRLRCGRLRRRVLDQADVRPSGGPASVGRGGDGERRYPVRQGAATDERPAGPRRGPSARPLLHPD